MSNDNELFVMGTQVQAGLDDHNESLTHAKFWKDKLNGYALKQDINKQAKINKPKVKENLKPKRKKKNLDLDTQNDLTKQRKFGSINKEIIRKFKQSAIDNNKESINDENSMKLLYNQKDWDSTYDIILSSIKNDDNDELIKVQKSNIIAEYTDFGQLNNDNLDNNSVDTQLTQKSCSYPSNLTPSDLGALYDITVSRLTEKMDKKDNFEKNIDDDTINSSSFQRSGVFTLSQVLGENTQRNMETQKSDYEIMEVDEVEDSCGSENEDDHEITIEFIEHIKEINNEVETGTQQIPIELDSGEKYEIIEVPNSSDDEVDGDIFDHIKSSDNFIEKSVIEVVNSSICAESDNDIVITRLPENLTQPSIQVQEIITHYGGKKGGSNKMIIPTSSPVSSQDIFDETPINSVESRVVLNKTTVNEVTTIPNSDDDDEDDGIVNDIFLTAPSQPFKIDQRLKHFEGWNVNMLKKQLGIWGVKQGNKMSKKSLEESLKQVCQQISFEKWEWAMKKTKLGELIDFSGWEDDKENVDMVYVTQDALRNDVYRKVHDVLKWDNEIRYDILTFKPIVANKIVEKVNSIVDGCDKIDRKLVCGVLDKLGVCWTDFDKDKDKEITKEVD
jgi:hypothetical protein